MANPRIDSLDAYFDGVLKREAGHEVPESLQDAFYRFVERFNVKSPTASTAASSLDHHANETNRTFTSFSPTNPFFNTRRSTTSRLLPPPSDLTDWDTIPSRESQINPALIQRKASQRQAPFLEHLESESRLWQQRYNKVVDDEAQAVAEAARDAVLQLTPSRRSAGREATEKKLRADYDVLFTAYQETWEQYKAAAKEASTHLMGLEDLKVEMMQVLVGMDSMSEEGIEDTDKERLSGTAEPAKAPAPPLQSPRTPRRNEAGGGEAGGGGEEERWRFSEIHAHSGGKRSTRRRGQGSRGNNNNNNSVNNATRESPEVING
ncbi:uncharacterized protein GLRG_11284 [Colletotrichum graminicola M1.001]|uniref:Uncharacterized protein n=1 Tax=Colletotrichum graminicola (strain M1.001 / M2 / FGSC 10212) TaxID=645133 RepID=E3QZ52_COLGM|nr:uncharacterized protein GLRG_11284 [Colletotrichum graminicola M1.001]EFQ36140.1 hypothetical protein GLRG_11284 [Colletotrichum graminicola M1.001]